MQQINILSCANLCLLQAIRCCVPIINCSKIIYCRVLIFPGSHTLVYANRVLYQGNPLSCVYISLRQAIRCCVLIISKVILLSGANIFLLQVIRCCVLIIYCSKVIFYRAPIFPSCNPYLTKSMHLILPFLCIDKRIMSVFLKFGRKSQPNI